MAKLFQITLPDGMSELKLDSQGRATVQYSVQNVSARPIDARAILVALPQSNPPDSNHPVQKGWIKIVGSTDQKFDTGKGGTYTVNIAVPPRSPAGTYSYRLDVVSINKPDEGDVSAPLKFTVAPPAVKPVNWKLIAIIAAAVLCVGGLLTWVLLKHSSTTTTPTATNVTVPANLVNMNLSDADKAIHSAGLQLGAINGDGTIVISTNPASGTSVASGSSVDITTQATVNCRARPCRFVGEAARLQVKNAATLKR